MNKLRTLLAAALVASGTIVGATSSVQAADVPFACDPGFYQVISGQLAELDPTAGTFTPLGADQTNYNAMGIRTADGFAYAIRNTTLLRIDAAGTVTELAALPIVPGAYTGDFADDGRLHVSRGGNDWYAIDVDSLTAERITAFSTSRGTADIANISGVFYGVSSQGRLWGFDPVAGTTTDGGMVTGLPAGSMSYGAAWSTAGGNLYIGRNSGEIYQITGFSSGSAQATQVATSPSTNANDGASCPLAAPPAGIADVDGPTPEVAPSTPEAAATAEAYGGSYQAPEYQFADAGIGSGAACDPSVDEDRLAREAVELATVDTATVLYDNGFGTDAAGAYVASGSWIIADGTYRQLNTCGFDYTVLFPQHQAGWFDIDVVFHSPEHVNQGGVVFNQSSVDTRSGAILVDLADEGSTLRWGRYDEAGYYENVGWDQIPAPQPNEPVTLHIEVRGSEFTVVHNGNVVVTAATTSPGGMVGLVASQSVVSFDQLTITAVPAS